MEKGLPGSLVLFQSRQFNYRMSICSNDCDEVHLWGQVDEEEKTMELVL